VLERASGGTSTLGAMMKVKKGDSSIPVPPLGLVEGLTFTWREGEIYWPLQRVHLDNILKMRKESKDAQGIPSYFATNSVSKTIEFHPAASYACVIKLRYYPPMVEV
jgi:hypothetical protein